MQRSVAGNLFLLSAQRAEMRPSCSWVFVGRARRCRPDRNASLSAVPAHYEQAGYRPADGRPLRAGFILARPERKSAPYPGAGITRRMTDAGRRGAGACARYADRTVQCGLRLSTTRPSRSGSTVA